jgi:predicted metal-dependent HD superfamily phosphohydrolase
LTIENVHKSWLELAQKYSRDSLLIDVVWETINKKYSERNRHYHNLKHIESMLELTKENETAITNLDEVLFAIWFHDSIYKSRSKRNEEKSANFAETILRKFNITTQKIENIKQLILSTKKHKIIADENADNAFLLDFDLSILGTDWSVYQNYSHNIRKEYKMYPDFLYKPARKKVLESFLNREKLYFTEKYSLLFEEKARENLQKELGFLG